VTKLKQKLIHFNQSAQVDPETKVHPFQSSLHNVTKLKQKFIHFN